MNGEIPAKRRWYRSVWPRVAVVAPVAILLATYLTVTLGYELAQGGIGDFGTRVRHAGGAPEAQYELVEGSRAELGFAIANPGPATVRVTDVTAGPLRGLVLDAVVMHEGYAYRGDGAVTADLFTADRIPFRATALNPDGALMVWLRIRVTGADLPYPPCSGLRLETATVRYTVLGVPRTQSLPMGFVASFLVPGAGCPE